MATSTGFFEEGDKLSKVFNLNDFKDIETSKIDIGKAAVNSLKKTIAGQENEISSLAKEMRRKNREIKNVKKFFRSFNAKRKENALLGSKVFGVNSLYNYQGRKEKKIKRDIDELKDNCQFLGTFCVNMGYCEHLAPLLIFIRRGSVSSNMTDHFRLRSENLTKENQRLETQVRTDTEIKNYYERVETELQKEVDVLEEEVRSLKENNDTPSRNDGSDSYDSDDDDESDESDDESDESDDDESDDDDDEEDDDVEDDDDDDVDIDDNIYNEYDFCKDIYGNDDYDNFSIHSNEAAGAAGGEADGGARLQ